MITDRIANALRTQREPMTGREIAALVSIPYKVVIDALGRMLDVGIVVRFGRKRGCEWALAGTEAALPPQGISHLEACWRAGGPPPPRGEGQSAPPAAH